MNSAPSGFVNFRASFAQPRFQIATALWEENTPSQFFFGVLPIKEGDFCTHNCQD